MLPSSFNFDQRIGLLFKDITQAAVMLAGKLHWLKERWANSLIVLAISRGGVVTDEIIANALGANLDVVVAKKVGGSIKSRIRHGCCHA